MEETTVSVRAMSQPGWWTSPHRYGEVVVETLKFCTGSWKLWYKGSERDELLSGS